MYVFGLKDIMYRSPAEIFISLVLWNEWICIIKWVDNHPYQSVIPYTFPVDVAFRVNGELMHVGLHNRVL